MDIGKENIGIKSKEQYVAKLEVHYNERMQQESIVWIGLLIVCNRNLRFCLGMSLARGC